MKWALRLVTVLFFVVVMVTVSMGLARLFQPTPVVRVQVLGEAWPLDKAFRWNVPLPPETTKLAVEIRTQSTPRKPKTTPVVETPTKPIPRAQSTATSLTSVIVQASDSRNLPAGAVVVFQVLDLESIGLTTPPGNSQLRMLATLNWGGAGTRLASDDAVLPAGKIYGTAMREYQSWIGDELLLGTFWIETEDAWLRKDVVLMKSVKDPLGQGVKQRTAPPDPLPSGTRSRTPFPPHAYSPSFAFFSSHSADSRLFVVASGLPERIASISSRLSCIAPVR